MKTEHFKKPPLPLLQSTNGNNPIEAVAILAGFTAKYQGGDRTIQDKAAFLAANFVNEGIPAAIAIEQAVEQALHFH